MSSPERPRTARFSRPRPRRQIIEAFSAGRGNGVLHLGAAELSTDLPPSLSYWRDVGRAFVGRVCGALDPTDPKSLVIPDPDPDEIAALVQAVPPMQGAEILQAATPRRHLVRHGRGLVDRGEGIQGRCPGIPEEAQLGLERGRPGLLPPGREQARPRVSLRLHRHLRAQGLQAGQAAAPAAGPSAQGLRRGQEPPEAARAAVSAVARGRAERVHPRAGRLRRHLPPAVLDTQGGPPLPVRDRAVRAGRAGRAHARLVERQEQAPPQGLRVGRRQGAFDPGHGCAAGLRRQADPRRQEAARSGRSRSCSRPARVWC